MPRRFHRKSRNGCQSCKRRHIKCDERLPSCVNCLTVGNKCSFDGRTTSKVLRHQHSLIAETITDGTLSIDLATADSAEQRVVPVFHPIVNLEHIELFHHWMTETSSTFIDIPSQTQIWKVFIVREGLKYPFLLHQLLALSAIHLSNTVSPQHTRFGDLATELQTLAMTGFGSLKGRVNGDSCVAVMLFSSLIALHVLADGSRFEGLNTTGTIDHFLHCIRLMHGVGAVVINDWWKTILQMPDFQVLAHRPVHDEPLEVPQQVRKLYDMLSSSDLEIHAVEACEKAIAHLEWLYASVRAPRHTHRAVRWIIAWPVRLSVEYLNLVEEYRPEALIILAFYVSVLYFNEHSWVIGNTARLLIEAIHEHLGEFWSQWFLYPFEILKSADEVCTDT